jgi:hypothetical protein
MNYGYGATFGWDSDRLVPGFSRRGLAEMNVPDAIRKCVLFLGIKKNGSFVPKATAFLAAHEEFGLRIGFLITAQHVISGLLTKGHDIWIRENLKNGTCIEQLLPRNIIWRFHPNEPRESDVAACVVNFSNDSDVHAIPLNGPRGTLATKDVMKSMEMGIGDEVVIVGLFTSHYGIDHNVPIVRIGNLAAVQGEPVKTKYCGYMDAHLIEARSIGGLSGSPVFLMLPPVRYAMQASGDPGVHRRQTIFTSGQGMFLLGLVHGHFDAEGLNDDSISEDGGSTGGINTGIGVVVPVEKILETINEPEWANERKLMILESRRASGAVADVDVTPSAEPVIDNPRHLEDFTSLLNAAAKTKPQVDQT